MKSSIENLKAQEEEYMNLKKSFEHQENHKLKNMQENIAQVLIALEENKKENEYYEERIHKLDCAYEEMIDKRNLTKIVAKYIDVLNELDKYLPLCFHLTV
jgi:hypothetical protein